VSYGGEGNLCRGNVQDQIYSRISLTGVQVLHTCIVAISTCTQIIHNSDNVVPLVTSTLNYIAHSSTMPLLILLNESQHFNGSLPSFTVRFMLCSVFGVVFNFPVPVRHY
jgi:hypothetical protein